MITCQPNQMTKKKGGINLDKVICIQNEGDGFFETKAIVLFEE
jgi:hypothetical protein